MAGEDPRDESAKRGEPEIAAAEGLFRDEPAERRPTPAGSASPGADTGAGETFELVVEHLLADGSVGPVHERGVAGLPGRASASQRFADEAAQCLACAGTGSVHQADFLRPTERATCREGVHPLHPAGLAQSPGRAIAFRFASCRGNAFGAKRVSKRRLDRAEQPGSTDFGVVGPLCSQ